MRLEAGDGFSRDRIVDREIADPDELRQYQIKWPCRNIETPDRQLCLAIGLALCAHGINQGAFAAACRGISSHRSQCQPCPMTL